MYVKLYTFTCVTQELETTPLAIDTHILCHFKAFDCTTVDLYDLSQESSIFKSPLLDYFKIFWSGGERFMTYNNGWFIKYHIKKNNEEKSRKSLKSNLIIYMSSFCNIKTSSVHKMCFFDLRFVFQKISQHRLL